MTQTRKRQKEFIHIGAVLRNALAAHRQTADPRLSRIWDAWAGAVGPVIAENARPAAFAGRRLIVHVTCSSWTHHLTYMKPELKNRVNAALGGEAIDDIQFRIGPLV